jgi:hypothetical protein
MSLFNVYIITNYTRVIGVLSYLNTTYQFDQTLYTYLKNIVIYDIALDDWTYFMISSSAKMKTTLAYIEGMLTNIYII